VLLRGSRRRAIALGAVALTIVGVVAVGVATATTTGNSKTRGVVLFVGDSNITLSTQAVEWGLTYGDHFDNGYVPVMASRVGASIRTPDCGATVDKCMTTDYWKLKLAGLLPKVTPDAIVNDLGVNDSWTAGTQNSTGYSFYNAKIDWFMALLPADTPVFWTNLACDILPKARETGCKMVNYALAAAPSRWPNLKVLDFASVARGHADWVSDGIHLTLAGQIAWTALVVGALDTQLPHP
jgi:hypothetical protein